eukprot:jgi/Astpho2/4958/e_gw1.00070.58.1_t
MLPPNKGWAVFLLWICAHAGGYIAARVNLPPLLGMLVAGIILQNIPQDPVKNLPSSWGTKIRTGGLAVILLRAGLKIDKVAFNRAPLVVLRLALVPMLCEAVVDSWLYYWLFKMPIALSFTAGFIQSAISPTVLVTGMLELQRQGLGQDKVIPSIGMAAAGLDSIGAIVGFAVASGVGIASGNLVYSILSGPLQVLYGLIVGAGCAFICSWTRLWNNVFKRTAALLVSALATMWLGLKFEYLGGSSVGCLSLGILVSFAWERGFPPYLCKGEAAGCCDDCDAKLAVVWIILVQPLLFGAIGIEINFHQIQGYVIPRTLVILAIGVLCTRFPAALLVLFGAGFNKKEQLFMASSWVPKATIQGALGSVPLLLIQSRLSGKADYAQYETWGSEILHATAFSILITAPVGLLVIGLLGKTCLKQVIIYTVSCCLPNQPQTQAQIQCQVCCGRMTLLMLPWIMLGPVSVQHLVGLGAPLTCSACFRRASLPLQQFYLQSMLCGLPLTTMTAVPLSQMWRVRLLQGVERSSRMHHHPPPCQIRETPAM